MPNPDGQIDSSNLCSQAVVERVLGDNSVTSVKIFNTLESDNFVTGSSGWQINRVSGAAEFQSATIRGTLNASDITAGTMSADRISGGTIDGDLINVIDLNASNISTGTLASARIATNSLSVSVISGGTYGNSDITFSSGSDLKSSNYVAGTSGWQITGAGVAEFQSATIVGSVTATSGSLSGLSVTGTLTLSGSGELVTAASGQRVEITSTDNDRITFYSGATNESTAAYVQSTGGTYPEWYIYGPKDTGSNNDINYIGLASENASTYGIDMLSIYQKVRLDGRSGGVEIWGDTGTTSAHVATFVSDQIKAEDGTATAPVYSFLSDTNTGVYREASGQVSISSDGQRAFSCLTTSNIARWYGIETNDWIQYDAVNEQWAMYVQNVQELLLGNTGFLVPNVYNNSVAGTANVLVQSDGSLRRATSSERYKDNIESFDGYRDVLTLSPIEFDELGSEVQVDDDGKPIRDKDGNGVRELVATGRHLISLSAEKAFAANPMYTTLDTSGRPEAIEWNAITGSLVAIGAEHDNRLARIETALGLED